MVATAEPKIFKNGSNVIKSVLYMDSLRTSFQHKRQEEKASINPEEWDGVGGGREDHDGGDILYLWLIHVDVWQKPAKYCKAVMLQLKRNKFSFF